METKICAACGESFTPRPQKPRQKYCSSPNCQSKRRQVWQKERLQDDQFHQENQADAQQYWLDRNPGYWKKYRSEHPEYVEQNRKKQRDRDSKTKSGNLAKSDVSIQPNTLQAGLYFLRPVKVPGLAKKDVWVVEITPVEP
jgi:hypothetical protein